MISDSSPRPAYTDSQLREASEWFVVIRANRDPDAESIHAWLKWMDQDDGNRAAFDAVARAWHGMPLSSMPLVPDESELSADEYQGDESIQAWRLSRGEASAASLGKHPSWAPRAPFSRRVWLMAAAVIMGLVGLGGVGRYLHLRSPPSEEFVTRTAEQMELTLTDGSHVWLGPRSTLRVTFESKRRGIQLASGEAFFSVKKDSQRPFVVRAVGGEIIAVGTAFNVRATDEQVTVAVSEGVISVTPMTQLAVRASASVRVASGQQLTFTAQNPLKSLAIVQSVATGERARWREGVLIYRDEPLREVIEDVLRYSDIQIEIADPAVGNLRYSGVVYHDALQEWLTALPESFPVTITRDGNREIISAR